MRAKWLALPVAAAGLVAGLDGSYVLPLEHTAIEYAKRPLNDPVTQLMGRIRSGQTSLEWDQDFGYLPALLKALNVPVSSQVLVFSKTSFQAPRISPRTPRALYFNDQVSVGYVRGGDVLEIASHDPSQGIIFYTMDQEPKPRPRLDRQDQCLQCHASGSTLGVPGLVVRSDFPDRTGMPIFQAGSFITDHRSPLKERWGGWYVSGTHGSMRHMGNTLAEDKERPDSFDATKGLNVTDLSGRFDTGAYLSPHSDIVALMVLEHQSRMQNMLTRVGWEARMALSDQDAMNKMLGESAGTPSESTQRRIRNATEELVRHMLFTDEAPLTATIRSVSGFAEEYSKSGPLKALDLEKRLYKIRCSPLIYSPAFDALPQPALDQIYKRLHEVLTGKDQSKEFASLTAADRSAILVKLRSTKTNLPAYWRQ